MSLAETPKGCVIAQNGSLPNQEKFLCVFTNLNGVVVLYSGTTTFFLQIYNMGCITTKRVVGSDRRAFSMYIADFFL